MSNVSEVAEPVATPKLAKVNKRDGRPQTFNPSKIEHAMKTVFYVTDKEKGIVKCRYCGKEQSIDKVKFIDKI
jgi:aspartate carbamoyltransferase regulatory subunit